MEHFEAVDYAFASAAAKRWKEMTPEHCTFLATLMAHAREGHLALDLANHPLLPAAESFPGLGSWVKSEGSLYYLQKNWALETKILHHVHRLAHSTPPPLSPQPIDPRLNPAQKEAVDKALTYSLSLITGGPGTGKTFTAAALIAASGLKERVLITAPTGKAASLLGTAIGQRFQTSTLHSLLARQEEGVPLPFDLILADECSMIDVRLFSHLLSCIGPKTRLVLIGDKYQLPPVEAGSVFADLIDAKTLPITELSQSLRSDRQEILSLSQAIQQGDVDAVLRVIQVIETPTYPFSYFLEKPDPSTLFKHFGQFALLSCMRQGPLGVDALNKRLFEQHLASAPAGSYLPIPILITRSDYEMGLYNGDVGVVLHPTGMAYFQSGKEVPLRALPPYEYGYCLSVHKSQGSEYDEILLIAPEGSEHFGREVFYTAVTRARQKVTLSGSPSVIREAVASSSRKRSGLVDRLCASP
ncbi:MAG: AAA family ATPase [Verrucomicrobia bacterium]|nr:AAA family ATPase [Verrucomicrobiota bacterium]